MPWSQQQTIRLHHTDAAGVIFYPRLFEMAHTAYEACLDELGQPLRAALAGDEPIAPIVRCEADYRRPLTIGTALTITIDVVREGERSYTLGFTFTGEDGAEVARAKDTHAAIDRRTGTSVPLTAAMRQGLAALR